MISQLWVHCFEKDRSPLGMDALAAVVADDGINGDVVVDDINGAPMPLSRVLLWL